MIIASLWGTLFEEEQNPAYGLLRPRSFLIEAVLAFEFVENSFLMIASIFFSSIEDAGDIDKVLFAKFLNILNRDCLINGVEFSS